MADISVIKLPNGSEYNIVDNTSGYATLASPNFTGTPTAPTPTASDNSTKIATTAYVDAAITNLPEPMLFKGSLGTGGTITSLPSATTFNEGFVYKVITNGTYASQAAKVGDIFISDGSNWVLIPSGDEPSGTVTSVGVANATNGGLSISGSPVTSSGSITVGHSNVLSSAQTTQAVYPIKIDKNGHISEYGSAVSIPTKVSDLTNDSGFITSYTETDPTVPSWAKASTKPSYTASQVGAAASDHVHGNITNGGDITATAPTVASGDQIIINDDSASKITNGPTFDGSTTTKALTPKGTWETFLQTDSDEKLSVTEITSGTTTYYPILTTDSSTASTKKYDKTVQITRGQSNADFITKLKIGDSSSYIGGRLILTNETNNKDTTIVSSASSTDKTITLPDATGTVALISDIPNVSGKIDTAGTGLSKSGTTLNHSNSVTAQTTQALYPIKIDAQGHISAYGTAVTSLPASDVSSWAKASSKPSYTASEVSAVALSDKYTRSSAGDLAWTNQTDSDAKVIAKSALAFWNGAYSGNSSNLSKCSTGNIIGSNGGTMTGQLLTSFKSSVAVGSYGTEQTTLPNFVGEVRFSSGCVGSVNITTAYTKNNVTVSTGWYNFLYSPHRSGGINGTASGDNCNYGTLILAGMATDTCGTFFLRVSSGSIQSLRKVAAGSYRTEFTPTSGSNYSMYGGCYYEYSGHIIHIHIGISGLKANTITQIYTLPSDCRPTTMIFGQGTGGTSSNIGYVDINTDGSIKVRSQGTYCGADITYMI